MVTVEELEQARMMGRFIRSGARLHEAFEAALRDLKNPLTPQAVEVLRVLCEHGPMTRVVLARYLVVEPASLGRLVNQLLRDGVLVRESTPGRKAVLFCVTEVGVTHLRAALELMQQQETLFFRGVGPAERELVLSIIQYGAESVQWEKQRHWDPYLRAAML